MKADKVESEEMTCAQGNTKGGLLEIECSMTCQKLPPSPGKTTTPTGGTPAGEGATVNVDSVKQACKTACEAVKGGDTDSKKAYCEDDREVVYEEGGVVKTGKFTCFEKQDDLLKTDCTMEKYECGPPAMP
jgi:hypothetical protein